jgi:carboxypeptidase Taq
MSLYIHSLEVHIPLMYESRPGICLHYVIHVRELSSSTCGFLFSKTVINRYSTENWLEGIAGTIHEVGHGLYEQGRNSDWDDLPISRALSMGVHESQSLFWERMIFQSRDFWVYATPLVHKYFPHTKDCSVDDFYAFVNRVEPGFIRVDADEVTYPIHIILRFEMEKQLFQNESTGEDVMKKFDKLPQQWNDVMKSSLGLVVPSHRHGILQDVHWPMGAFGYFPSYTLGAIIAVQLYNHALLQIPDMKGKVQRGEFKDIREHLRKEIHEVGSFYASPDELLLQVTGEKMNPSHFISYLDNKYKKLYKLD